MIVKIIRNPWLVGFTIFFGLGVLLSPLIGKRVCKDGWRSSAIGSSGACSWHGGVGGLDRGGWVGPFRMIAGIAAGFAMAAANNRPRSSPPIQEHSVKTVQLARPKRAAYAKQEDLEPSKIFNDEERAKFAKKTREAEKRLEQYLQKLHSQDKKSPRR